MNWFLFRDYLKTDPFTSAFQLILERKDEFIRNNGRKAVEDRMNDVFLDGASEMYWRGEYTVSERRKLREMVRENRTADYRVISTLLDLAEAKEASVAKLVKVAGQQLHISTLDPRYKFSIFKDILRIVLEKGSGREKEKFRKVLKEQITLVPDEQGKEYYQELLQRY